VPVVIGVAGGSASGKTTVVQEIVRALGADAVTHIEHDAYYFDRSAVPPAERHPDTRTALPRAAVIVDGILILAEVRLRALMDIRVFVDTDADMRFIRRLLRDNHQDPFGVDRRPVAHALGKTRRRRDAQWFSVTRREGLATRLSKPLGVFASRRLLLASRGCLLPPYLTM
jgi:uridine kinase